MERGIVSEHGLQPLLHDLVTVVAAPVVALSEPGGQIRPVGAQGIFAADLRVLSRAELTVDDREPEPVSGGLRGAAAAEFISVLRDVGDPGPDPTVWLRRRRTARPDGCTEELTIENAGGAAVTLRVRVALAADLAPIELVKSGGSADPRPPVVAGETVRWTVEPVVVAVVAPGAEIGRDGSAAWQLTVPGRGSSVVGWRLSVADAGAVVIEGTGPYFGAPIVTADDRRLAPLVARSLDDLTALRLATVTDPGQCFLAAGSPWYLTLFGRDSLWSARMLLPLGTELAGGTLRTLAARQGNVTDPGTAEQPGKILHEIRRGAFAFGAVSLPPVYYGSVDSTLLWICLLADAWRWGLPAEEVAVLIPAAEAALEWMADSGDSDGDGFLEYADTSGRGLANQGWKDSGDSIRFADGRIADGPVALAEVQGYAYEAAHAGAALLDAFGRPGADRWRCYAGDLADRFRSRFWVDDGHGRYPALALDGQKRPVDAVASNMGHLLGTGILSEAESALVADRLVGPSMFSGFGLRTMSTDSGGYSPLSYHCGSVWPHDTAIAVHGLLRAGFPIHAARLAEGLLAAGTAFGGRLPELFGGFAADDVAVPVPYPASCRPQAWSAAAAVVIVQAFLGLEANVPGGSLTINPTAALGGLRVDGFRIAGQSFSAAVAADGTAFLPTGSAGLTVRSGGRPSTV